MIKSARFLYLHTIKQLAHLSKFADKVESSLSIEELTFAFQSSGYFFITST